MDSSFEALLCENVDEPEAIDAAPELSSALAMARAFRENTAAIRTLSTHEQRLQRTFHQTLKLLQTLQAQRQHEDHQKLKNAALLQQANKQKGLPYNPADDGFVFSNAEIDLYLSCEARVKGAHGTALYNFMPAKVAPRPV